MRRIKGFLLLLLALSLVLTGCGGKGGSQANGSGQTAQNAADSEPEPVPGTDSGTTLPTSSGSLVGISMSQSEKNAPGFYSIDKVAAQLRELGYRVDLQFADNDASTQVVQIENLLANDAKVIVINPAAKLDLASMRKMIEAAGSELILYGASDPDGAIASIDFIYEDVGEIQADYIIEALDLDHAEEETYNIEFVGGDPEDEYAVMYHKSALKKLQPYLDSGILVCQSGQTEMEDIATEGWDAGTAKRRFEELLTNYYHTKEPLHAVIATNDALAQSVTAALSSAYENEVYPVITGKDCEIRSVANILDGKQAMSLYYDKQELVSAAVGAIDTLMRGGGPVESQAIEPQICTKNNVRKLLILSGHFTQEELDNVRAETEG